jgi:hypothetical protein
MRWALLGFVVIAALALSGPASAKTPNARDVTATRRFVAAESRFDRTELAQRGAITSAAEHYVKVVKARCGGDLAVAASGSLTRRAQKVVKALTEEVGFDLYAVSTRSILPAEHQLERALRRVNFTQPRLDAIVASIELGNRPAAPGDDACADIKAARTADFAAEPAGTVRLLKRVSDLSAGASTYVPRGLKPYLITPADRAAFKTLRVLDKRQTTFTDNFTLNQVGRLFSVLVGQPPVLRRIPACRTVAAHEVDPVGGRSCGGGRRAERARDRRPRHGAQAA